MKGLIQAIGRILGIGFAPGNSVIPVMRLGRYHTVKGPGFFRFIPLFECLLPPVKTGIHVGNFTFSEVMSGDNVSFTFCLTVLFVFKPGPALKEAAAQLAQGNDHLLQTIIKDCANQGLRRLASRYKAEELGGVPATSAIERDLTYFLIAELHHLGLAPLKNGGILIKKAIVPEANQNYPVPGGLKPLNQIRFIANLADHSGELALFRRFPEVMPAAPISGKNEACGQNGYH